MLLTVKQVCKMLKITKMTLYNWEKSGKIKRIKMGDRIVRYEKSEIERFLKGGNE